ncbi:MAG TPA: hypothetical protein VMS89_02275 [Methanoregulaceae archaeon]|nr:hypothetical protein [Methanoregulaceae archaeon]
MSAPEVWEADRAIKTSLSLSQYNYIIPDESHRDRHYDHDRQNGDDFLDGCGLRNCQGNFHGIGNLAVAQGVPVSYL